MDSNPIRVLLVDDHELLRDGIRLILSSTHDIEVVAETGTGEEAIELVRKLKPDLVLLDLNMPGIGGIETAKRLLRANSKTKIMVLTSCDEEPLPSSMMQAGCSGYLTKDSGAKEIEHAIRLIVRSSQTYMSDGIAQQLAMRRVKGGAKPKVTNKIDFSELSDRELQVFKMIVSGKKPKKIAELLKISDKTVNTYRYRIFEKLSVENDVALARLAFQANMMGSMKKSSGSDEL